MDVKELRIGNLIQCFAEDAGVYAVEEIKYSGHDRNNIGISFREGSIWGVVDEDADINPIQLTEDWLLKLGFEKTNSSFVATEDKSDISYEYSIKGLPFYGKFIFNIKYGEGYFDYHYCVGESNCEEAVTGDVKYVHKLQNLYYALTGKELQITPPITKPKEQQP